MQRIYRKASHVAHEVGGKLGSKSSAVLISPKKLRRGAVRGNTDNSEIGFGIEFHVLEIFSRTRHDEDFPDQRLCVKARRNRAGSLRSNRDIPRLPPLSTDN